MKIKVEKPKCSAALLLRKGGNITKQELQKCDSLFLQEGCDYKIVSYKLVYCFEGKLVEMKATETKFSDEMKSNFRKLENGNRIFVEEIKIMNSAGQIFKLPDLVFKVSIYP
jgi:hypothetical protein